MQVICVLLANENIFFSTLQDIVQSEKWHRLLTYIGATIDRNYRCIAIGMFRQRCIDRRFNYRFTMAIVSSIIDSYDSFQMISCSPFPLIEKCLSCSPLSFLFIVLEFRNNTVLLFKLFAVVYCHYVKFVKKKYTKTVILSIIYFLSIF